MAYMTGLIGTIQQLETTNATPDPQIWSDSLSGLGTGQTDQSYNGGNLTTYMGGIVLKDDGSTMLIGSMAVSYTHLPSPRDMRRSRMPSSA